MKKCRFCKEGIKHIDYKRISLLRPHITSFNKIQARRYSNLCLNHQKQMSNAVKNARIVALLPFVP
ncbi:30S ribosomal protein S18 [Candidatus Peregrinibacteria bacterium CG22_combo_CG10-13_8_21_14_all_44_10]|nr:MAG: 30S ribosomal protein S18 [Candidatus Peregrinibacteria bacterium CG22_combo_CG10-13_8_21_14_all_44_10]PIS04161.1 MAG: 30S ribosomal protein S18 [Candidatus Peregrinibacteria bacterium CG10_big_fil_rev_8_21_14_0_10_44_7]PIX79833.1 MAG: 30S ribosomal protein S18 [Candidatus Peregrinibacteria bacterium CG_4_10_14_3_um_filter_44_21]PJB89153.1 MAG: 30S ribosomal protein S18 [Candidatus Peregrinibacteria bacterium CG_4_9_14_0_8_um_filter_44_15]